MKHEKPIVDSNLTKIKNYIDIDSPIIFEIGAYDGIDIDEIVKTWNNCKIYAFEPDPESFNILKDYESINIICNNIALSNVDGKTKFIKCLDPDIEDQSKRHLWLKTAQSLRKNTEFHKIRPMTEIEIDVDVTTIKKYCELNEIYPDILLLDTQGSEWEILDGAADLLFNVKIIMTEWSSVELYVGQKMLSDIELLLSTYGFQMIEKINLWGDFHGDAIFMKNSPSTGKIKIKK